MENQITLTKLDQYLDYVPVVSTVTNLVDIFIKSVNISNAAILDNYYFAHLDRKSYLRCVILLIPVIGQLAVFLFDFQNGISPKDFETLDKGLKKWKDDPAFTGEKNLAITRIREAVKTNAKTLNLGGGRLNHLPKEIGLLTNLSELNFHSNIPTSLPTEIGLLTKLTELLLTDNFLYSLPTEIGMLTKLTALGLQRNNLTSLPTEIGKLTNLQRIGLWKNEITFLPREIGQLTNLSELVLDENKLTSLPTEIGRLTEIKTLAFKKNDITSLPTEIGQLTNLTQLILSNNRNLRELPLSLGQIPGLTHIETEESDINRWVSQPILDQCRRMRDADAVTILPARLAKWEAIAGDETELNLEGLSDEQKRTLNEWLLRLEKTKDFDKNQSTLAQIVCAMLKDLKNQEFHALFFNQAEANNACCQDRAAMSLNEIYTSWQLLCKAPHYSEKEKLNLMVGIAKTVRLRKTIENLIQKHEREMKKENDKYTGERESVEIYLYNETMLREPLQLVTAINAMTYAQIGQRDWIKQSDLIQDVNDNFFEELIEIPLFDKMMAAQFETMSEESQKELEELGVCPTGGEYDENVLKFKEQQGEILQKLKMKKVAAAKLFHPISLQIIDQISDETFAQVLKIQESLVVPLEAVEMPPFAKTGFLTIRMTPEYLHRFINDGGKLITASRENQLVGYLLLDKIDGFIEWAHGKRFDSSWNLETLKDICYIDQIAVPTQFAKQGIGKALLNQAKSLSPKGLLTDILHEPYPNPASRSFFTKNGFTEIGIIHVDGNAARPAHKTSVFLSI